MTHNGQTDKNMDSSSGPRSTAIEIEEQTAVKIQAVNSSVAITLPDKIVPDESCRTDPRYGMKCVCSIILSSNSLMV